ncbi:MAG: hypothetical protein KatS3mg081_1975 [Gemmatimonadales bacterium]|nr:MAG: hypothetical protein KatS3mg081_1975 [Gemmatimonadales bacterium]
MRAVYLWSLNLASALALLAGPLHAQGPERNTQPQSQRAENGYINQSDDPLLRAFRWRSIGPAGQGGRVDDIAVVEDDPSTFYVGFATGGVWKTTNNGTTFEPIFDTYSAASIGDIAIAPSNPDIVWVGTGEPNNRQSSSFGDGIYKSTDGGKTFSHMGLRETQTIARIVIHPTNPDIVWVAAVGHLFGPNSERGVFKTQDGGRTWRRVLYVDENTGATDLAIDPSNPNTLFAATYQRRRTAWGFVGGGPGSGIWRSDDGGETWNRITGNGLPSGTMGRIALDFSRSNPNVIYAQIEVAPDKLPVVAQRGRGGQGQGGAQGPGGGGGFGGPPQCPQTGVVQESEAESEEPGAQQQQAPEPDPECSGIWRSNDKGRTWEFLANQNVRPMYFSQIRVDPNDENTVYTAGVQAYKSTDGGRTWRILRGMGHVDHHAIWINPKNSRHVMYGNDGSVDVSYDGGETWESLRSWAVGQPYHVSVDMRRPYYVCTGLQDNGSWCGPSSVRSGPILNQDWYRVGGGDGFYTAVDPTDWTIVYSESQNGNVNRYDLKTGEQRSIRPRAPLRPGQTPGGGAGQFFQQLSPEEQERFRRGNIVPPPPEGTQFRWNWNTPILISPHNPRLIYVGGNRLFKSYDRGDTWTMTEDLTKAIDPDRREIMGQRGSLPRCGRERVGPCILSKNDGVNAWGTITTIAESPVVPGILWVGTDDGNIQVSRDGGATWTEVGKNIPGGTKEYYISRIEASYFDPATAYVSVDGHRHDDLRPYVWVTRDYGATWTSIAGNLPPYGNVNTIRQDPRNPKLLYLGTEFAFYVSLDEGKTWKRFMTNLPTTRFDDVLVHPRDNDLVLATHGRSIWIADDITPLQQLNDSVLQQDVYLFQPRSAVLWKTDRTRSRSVTGDKNFAGENAPDGTAISYYLKAPAREVKIAIVNAVTGEVFRNLDGSAEPGINRVQWDLRGNPPPRRQGQGGGFGGQQRGPLATPGVYRVVLTVDDQEYWRNVEVLEDIWLMER